MAYSAAKSVLGTKTGKRRRAGGRAKAKGKSKRKGAKVKLKLKVAGSPAQVSNALHKIAAGTGPEKSDG
jgi:hypothetical protein